MTRWERVQLWGWLFVHELGCSLRDWSRARLHGPGGILWTGEFTDSDPMSYPNLQDLEMRCPETQPTSKPGLLDTDHGRLKK